MSKNMLVAQSGGPTAAINATLSGVILEGIKHSGIGKIYGSLNGISGVLEDRIIEIGSQLKSEKDFRLLECTPAMALGSCRFKLPPANIDAKPFEKISATFERYNIGYFLYIGGNDSMDTAQKLNDYFSKNGKDIKVIGVPKTIDNDLCCTDHTPGFGSAAKFVATAVAEMSHDCNVYGVDSVTIVEIMGRHTGWLTSAAMLPRALGMNSPQFIYLPEVAFDLNKFADDINSAHKTRRSVVVAIAEGIKFADGNYVSESEQDGETDVFGHCYLSGAGKFLERFVAHNIGCKVRSVELNILQRCAGHLLSATDINESRRIGQAAVSFALSGQTGVMAAFKRVSNEPYVSDICAVPLSDVANVEKRFPNEWINASGNDLTDDVYTYLLPLISGEVASPTRLGMPNFFEFKR